MDKVKRTERGWAGHFVAAQDCRFRRNTLLQLGDKFIVVSTVGGYFYKDKLTEIGWDRYYETMAFYSDPNDKVYHDINVSEQIYADAKWAIDKKEMKQHKDSIDNIANEMHEAYVKKVEEMLLNNEL